MKLTIRTWSEVQNHLPVEGRADEELWYLIEAKTEGRLYVSSCAILLTKEQEAMVNAALEEIDSKRVRWLES